MKKSPSAIERCKTVSTIQKILGGKWKIEIPPPMWNTIWPSLERASFQSMNT